MQYLRAITGSADGKIRIWNILNGDCLRVMRGNSQCDPIYSLSISDNRMLINTEFNLILMEFEKVVYEYGGKRELDIDGMAQTLQAAVKFVEQGHVRVGPERINDPAFLVTRKLEDYVTWTDTSAIRKQIQDYNGIVSVRIFVFKYFFDQFVVYIIKFFLLV